MKRRICLLVFIANAVIIMYRAIKPSIKSSWYCNEWLNDGTCKDWIDPKSAYISEGGDFQNVLLANVVDSNSNKVRDAREIQNRRLKALEDKCITNTSSSLRTNDFDHFIYNDKQKIIYCFAPKVACTNWKRVFLLLEGKISNLSDVKSKMRVHGYKYNFLSDLNETERNIRLNSYYKFLFARHPLERILSAYRNKFVDPYNNLYQKIIGPHIVRLFRKSTFANADEDVKNVTFHEFIRYIIYLSKKRQKLDQHWDLVSKLCHPCSVKYNYIGKMETLLSDSEEILNEIGVSDKITFPNVTNEKYTISTKELMRKNYLNISKDEMDILYNIYKDDFNLFGYDYKAFYKDYIY